MKSHLIFGLSDQTERLSSRAQHFVASVLPTVIKALSGFGVSVVESRGYKWKNIRNASKNNLITSGTNVHLDSRMSSLKVSSQDQCHLTKVENSQFNYR